jgi:hypothetical protein
VWLGPRSPRYSSRIGKFLIGLYLGKSAVASAYGAAGFLVVIVVWGLLRADPCVRRRVHQGVDEAAWLGLPGGESHEASDGRGARRAGLGTCRRRSERLIWRCVGLCLIVPMMTQLKERNRCAL